MWRLAWLTALVAGVCAGHEEQPWNGAPHRVVFLPDSSTSEAADELTRALFPNGTFEMVVGGARPLVCYLPSTNETRMWERELEEEVEELDEASQKRVLAAAAPAVNKAMMKECVYTVIDHWTYEVCRNKQVTQFLQNPEDFRLLGVRRPNRQHGFYYLGKWGHGLDPLLFSLHTLDPKNKYVLEVVGAGTLCDITNLPRKVEVRYLCDLLRKAPSIVHVMEKETCEYVLEVAVPELCGIKELVLEQLEVVPSAICAEVQAAGETEVEEQAEQPGAIELGGDAAGEDGEPARAAAEDGEPARAATDTGFVPVALDQKVPDAVAFTTPATPLQSTLPVIASGFAELLTNGTRVSRLGRRLLLGDCTWTMIAPGAMIGSYYVEQHEDTERPPSMVLLTLPLSTEAKEVVNTMLSIFIEAMSNGKLRAPVNKNLQPTLVLARDKFRYVTPVYGIGGVFLANIEVLCLEAMEVLARMLDNQTIPVEAGYTQYVYQGHI